MIDDRELLRRYREEQSQEAFAELVACHINLAYGTAFRHLNDSHLAKDVTQLVFLDLARKASALARHPTLVGWIYTSVVYASAKERRSRERRRRREEIAHLMNELNVGESDAGAWERIRPGLDSAPSTLPTRDREIILFRYPPLVILCALFSILLVSGCVSKKHKWGWLGWNLNLNLPPFDYYAVVPPRLFTFPPGSNPDLSLFNLDHFFPDDVSRILVAKDAFDSGLFSQPHGTLSPVGRRYIAPNLSSYVEIASTTVKGRMQEVLLVFDGTSRAKTNHWTLGRFTEIYWSPDSTFFGFNEQLPGKGDARTYSIVELATSQTKPVSLSVRDLSPFFTADQLAATASVALRGWLSPTHVLVWVHGSYGSSSFPGWGYEALIDLSAHPEKPNGRILRAFVR